MINDRSIIHGQFVVMKIHQCRGISNSKSEQLSAFWFGIEIGIIMVGKKEMICIFTIMYFK